MKKFAVIAFVALCTARIFSIEYGAVLSESTDFKFLGNKYSQVALEQKEMLSPYIKVPIDDSSYFAAGILLEHKLIDVLGISYKASNEFILDLTRLEYYKAFKLQNANVLELSVGRFNVNDATSVIFDQNSDGALATFTSQRIRAGAYAGYTGLLNLKTVEIISSDGALLKPQKERIIYDFAMPYVIASANIVAPYLFASQTLGLELLGAFAVGGPNKLPDGENNRIYATLFAKGPIIPELFYTASLTFQTKNFGQAALLFKTDLTYYAPFKDATLGFAMFYASGNNGALSPFVGITKQVACFSAQEPGYSGLLKMGVFGSIVPVKNLLLTASTDIVFNTMENAEYYGFQIAANAYYQLFSDLEFSLGVNTFIGKTEATNRTQIVLGASIAF